MSGTIFKYNKKKAIIILLVMTSLSLFGQEESLYRALKLTVGGGYGYYFNTFTNVLDEDVKNSRPSFSGKLMWQPEHRLRIGFESGYYEIYSTSRIEAINMTEKLTTNLNVYPLFLSLAFNTTRYIDINFATGGAIMTYGVTENKSKKNIVEGKTLSLSNFSTGVSCFFPLGNRLELGAEFKYLYLGKTQDHHLSAFLDLSYKIVKRKVN